MAGKLSIASWVTTFLLITLQAFTVGAQTKITAGRGHEPRTIPLLVPSSKDCLRSKGSRHRSY
jgi:hypothetical protein